VIHTPTDVAAIHLQLLFAGAAQAHAAHTASPTTATARLAGQVRPGPGQAGQAVFVLGQFDLQGPFAGAGMLGEEWDPLESTCRHASLSIL
jgi:hypothetical protein